MACSTGGSRLSKDMDTGSEQVGVARQGTTSTVPSDSFGLVGGASRNSICIIWRQTRIYSSGACLDTGNPGRDFP
jgi:hypothetical protein